MSQHLLTFIHISDTHIHTDPDFTGAWVDFSSRRPVQAMIESINSLPFHIDFILHTGDVMTKPQQPEDYVVAREILGQLKHPIYYVPGNNDDPQWLQSVLLEQEPNPHLDYTFEHNGVQFICLDSHDPNSRGGKLEPEQLAWLDDLCSVEDDRPLVIAIHHHVLLTGSHQLDSGMLRQGDALHQTLLKVKHRLRGVFYGHIHEQIITTRDGITYYSVLSGWLQGRTWYNQEQFILDLNHDPGYHVVTLTEQDTFVRQYRV